MKKLFIFIALIAVVAVLTACGEDSTGEKANAETVNKESVESSLDSQVEDSIDNRNIEVTDSTGRSVAFEEQPQSFAALSSGDIDILTALGANVVGRPTSQGPVAKELETVEQIGNPHQPNFEKIAEVHPDVMIASASMKAHEANLERQGIKMVYTAANSVSDIQQTISLVGQLLGKDDDAKSLNDKIDEDLATGKEGLGNKGTKALLVYGAPGTYLAALPNSLSGDLLELAGGENIASDFPNEDNYPQYASLSVEKIIERNPEVVMLITHGDPQAVKAAFEEEMMKNPAWKNLDAVKDGRVVVLPSDLFGTNPGTRVIEAFNVMKESLEEGAEK